MRRAKIVCTLGPATDFATTRSSDLVDAGMDIARLNFSHGTHAEHEERYRRVRKASDETGRSVGTLADLQGPKIRLGHFGEGPYSLNAATASPSPSRRASRATATLCGTTYKRAGRGRHPR